MKSPATCVEQLDQDDEANIGFAKENTRQDNSLSFERIEGERQSNKLVEGVKIEHEVAPAPILPNFLPKADEVSESVESS